MRLGINHSNVTRWVREHRNAQEEPSRGGVPHSELEAENRRLRKENRCALGSDHAKWLATC